LNAALDLAANEADVRGWNRWKKPVWWARKHDDLALRFWLRGALSKLNPRHAEMFALRYFEEYDNREIAQLMKDFTGRSGHHSLS